MQTVWPILHLFVVTAKTIIEGMVEATHKGFNTTMVEANLEGMAMLEVTLKAVAEVVVEAVTPISHVGRFSFQVFLNP